MPDTLSRETLVTDIQLTIPVVGMTCANCALTVERSASRVAGVSNAVANFGADQLTVTYDPRRTSIEAVVAAVEGAGYRIPVASLELPITGMTCANCVNTVERTLNKKLPGVTKATVNFATERASITFVPGADQCEEFDTYGPLGHPTVDERDYSVARQQPPLEPDVR